MYGIRSSFFLVVPSIQAASSFRFLIELLVVVIDSNDIPSSVSHDGVHFVFH